MFEAVSTYAARAGEKLRRYELAAGYMTVFMHTSRFASTPSYSGSKGIEFSPATNDSRMLIAAAQRLARQVWREGFAFSEAGVMFDDLIPQVDVSPGLFDAPDDGERNARLMIALDQISRRWGRNAAIIGATGLRPAWTQEFQRRSPSFTTKLADLPLC